MSRSQERLSNLDVLRAFAAIAVCLHHFSRDGFIGAEAITAVFQHGHLGVDVFFVISGFIIPLSLSRTNYELAGAKAFLVSRFIRLYPAYFVAGLASILLWYLSALVPGFRGESPSFSVSQLLSNGLFLCDFTGESWLVPIFWTLAIEAQYYLLIAVSFPWLNSASRAIRRACLAIWLVAPLVAGEGPSVFTWTSLFALGIVSFLWKEKKIPLAEFLVAFVLAVASHAFTRGSESAVFGIMTAGVIVLVPTIRFRPLIWVGTISYSLYLIHVLIGGRIVNLAERLPDLLWLRLLAIAVAVVVSIAAAALFFHWIEKPSHKYARKVRKQLLAKEK